MDFVEGLGDTSGVIEFAVDDVGRIEVRGDRVRVTMIAFRDGGLPFAACSMVWTASAWKAAQVKVEQMREIVAGKKPDPHETRVPLMGGSSRH